MTEKSTTKKFIFIPVVNNFHLLQKAINSVPANLFDEYFICNNSTMNLSQHIDLKHFTVFDYPKPLTFKDTQNRMRQYAIENNYDYYSFMHNDGEILDDSAYRIIQKADEMTENNEKWGVIFTHYDVFCVYSTKCVTEIGEWGDDRWPPQKTGYYLDTDYYRRMAITGHLKITLENSNVAHHEVSNTIKDQNELRIWNSQQKKVQEHYIFKWGGLPGSEWLDPPFDTR
jgi:hypothetical protein